MSSLHDDDALLAALEEALAPSRRLDLDRLHADARDAYAFRAVADEFAALVYDSALAAEPATSRDLTEGRTVVFESGAISVEIEIGDDAIVGQLTPPGQARVEAEFADGRRVEVETDDLGCFTLPTTGGLVRFHVTSDGSTTVTDWA